MNDLLLHALKSKNTSRKPVWLMRQAGRSLPEYQTIRKKFSLSEMFVNPELIAKTTLLPIDILGVDAAILFSDIMVIAKVLGFDLTFVEGKGPVLSPLLQTDVDIEKIEIKEVREALGFVADGIKLLKPKLKVPLIGFCGAPFTVANYLMEDAKRWLYQRPESFHLLLEKITIATLSYIEMQIEEGVQAFQIFESFGHVLSHSALMSFSFPYLKRIIAFVQSKGIPVILFMKGSSLFPKELAALSPDAISFDWHKDLYSLRREVPATIAIQGNFDPHLLLAPKERIKLEVLKAKKEMHIDKGYIVNLGHGILPSTAVDNARFFIELWKT